MENEHAVQEPYTYSLRPRLSQHTDILCGALVTFYFKHILFTINFGKIFTDTLYKEKHVSRFVFQDEMADFFEKCYLLNLAKWGLSETLRCLDCRFRIKRSLPATFLQVFITNFNIRYVP